MASLEQILIQVEANTAQADAALKGTAANTERLAESMEEAVEPINKLKASIDSVSDQLALFGDRGNEAKTIIEGISDPVLRLRAAQQLSEQAMKGQGNALSALSDRLKVYKAQAVLTLGGQEAFDRTMEQGKLAVLGFAGAVAGAGVAALKSFVSQNKQTKEASDRLKKGLDGLVYTLGNALVGGGARGGKALDLLTGVANQLAKSIDENRQTIADFAIGAAKAFLYVGEYGGKAILGLKIAFNVLQDLADNVAYGIGETFHGVTVTLIEAAKTIADLLPENVNQALGDPARYWGEALRDAQQDLQAFYAGHGASSPGFKRVQESADQIDAYTKTFDDLRAKLTSLEGVEFQGTGGRAPRGGGGGGGAGAAEAAPPLSSAGLSGLFGDPLRDTIGLADELAAGGERAQASFSVFGDVLRNVVQPAAQSAFASMGAFYERAAAQTQALISLTGQLKRGFVGVGVGALQGLTALALGAQTGGGALGAMIGNLGELATSMGQTLILAGAGFSALPLGFSAAGAIAAGVGLVALGTVLGTAGARVSAPSGAGGATSSAAAAPLSPSGGGALGLVGSAPPPRETRIVLQLGAAEVGEVVVGAVEDAHRRGALRLDRR